MKNTPFDLNIPLATRLAFLKDWDSYQAQEIQLDCEHKNFTDGKCELCDYECEHPESEDSYCLDCGEFIEPFYPYDTLEEREGVR